MLIGQSWTWIQVLSPILCLKGIAYRFIIEVEENKKSKNLAGKCTIFTNVCCVVPIFIFAMSMFVFTEQRPEWARKFPAIRYGLDEKPYPSTSFTDTSVYK